MSKVGFLKLNDKLLFDFVIEKITFILLNISKSYRNDNK
jgi:hypothetical protein